MSEKYDTPQGLEPDSRDVNEWVRFQLLKIHDRTRTIENKVAEICSEHRGYNEFVMETKVRLAEGVKTFQNIDTRLMNMDEQIKDLKAIRNNPGKNNHNSVTFQWLLEKFALPIVMALIGGAIVLLFK